MKSGELEHRDHVVQDPKICGGRPVVKGTRITVHAVISSLAQGSSIEDLLTEFPTLTEEGIKAALAFAAECVLKNVPGPPEAA